MNEDAALKTPASVREIVSQSLRGSDRALPGDGPARRQEQAALGAAISILACLEDDAIGPLPELKEGLVKLILTPAPAA